MLLRRDVVANLERILQSSIAGALTFFLRKLEINVGVTNVRMER